MINQEIEDQQDVRQLIMNVGRAMDAKMDALNARMERLEAIASASARQEATSALEYGAAAGEQIVKYMSEMQEWRKEIIVRNAVESERSERHDGELDQINIRCSRHALEISKVRTYAQDVHERADLYEAKATRSISEVAERLSRQSRLAYEDLQERVNEYSQRYDKASDLLGEQIKGMDERMDDFVAMDFHPIIDGRFRELTRELDYKVAHLAEKTGLLATALENQIPGQEKNDPGVEHLRDTVVQLRANMDCLHREQLDAAAKLNVVDHCSMRLDRGMAELRAVIEKQEVTLNEKIATSYQEAISWFQDTSVGTETVNAFSLTKNGRHMKKSPKKERRKKNSASKRRSRHDNDPDSSDSSSSSSSSDTDESERPRKSRKRKDDSDTESDSDEDRKSTRKRNSRRDSKLLDPKHFGSGRHRASILGGDGDSNGRSDRSKGSSRQANDSIIFVQPTPVVQTLKLSEVTVGKVMHFCKTFNNESSRFRGGLNASNYIDDRLLCQMKQVALRHDLAGRDGILTNGRQEIRNKDIFAILAMMCAPTSKEEMQRQLAKSVWPRKNDFGSVEEIMKNIAEYRAETLIYVDRFEDKVKLLGFHDCSARYIPKALFKKGGGDPGLADYFIQGLPDKNFGMRVWLSVDEDRRRKCERWRRFVKLYMRAIDLMETREKDKEINRQICLGVREMIKADQMRQSPKASARESPQKIHAMKREDSTAGSEEEPVSDEEIEIVFKKMSEEDEMPSMIEREDEDLEADKENTRSLAVTADDLSQLANLLQPSDTRKAGVCYDMLYQGKCVKENCPYSHKDEDIQQAKKLKALKFGGQNTSSAKQVSFQKSPNQALRKA